MKEDLSKAGFTPEQTEVLIKLFSRMYVDIEDLQVEMNEIRHEFDKKLKSLNISSK